METKSIAPETIVSGFAHLLWILILFLLCGNIDILKMFEEASQISSGATILLGSVAFGISHFLGTLINRILSSFIAFLRGSSKEERQKVNEAISKTTNEANEYYMSWRARHFFLSMSLAILMMVVSTILLDNKITSGNNLLRILFIGIPILVITVTAFFFEHNYFVERRRVLLNKQNKSEKILSLKKNKLFRRRKK